VVVFSREERGDEAEFRAVVEAFTKLTADWKTPRPFDAEAFKKLAAERRPPTRLEDLPMVARGPVWWDPRDPMLDEAGDSVKSPFEVVPPPYGWRQDAGTRARHEWEEAVWNERGLDPTHMPEDQELTTLTQWWHALRREAQEKRRLNGP
jgi:hypothetical protein